MSAIVARLAASQVRPAQHRLDAVRRTLSSDLTGRLRLAPAAAMTTNRTSNPSIRLARLASELDELVQQVLAQEPFDEAAVSLATAMIAHSVEQLEEALYLSDCLTDRSAGELALPNPAVTPIARAA
jgi:hypothetical protein